MPYLDVGALVPPTLETEVHATLNGWQLGLVNPLLQLVIGWQRRHVVADENWDQDS